MILNFSSILLFSLKKIKKSKSTSGSTGQICELCGQVLVKNHQCRPKESFTTCSMCQKQMSTKSYRAHLQYHRKKEVSNYLCQFCNKSFTTETSLKRHVLIHENKKPFSCSVCEKSFRQKSALIAHERVHTGMRFECIQCNKKFITKSLMKKHLQQSHHTIPTLI